MSRTSTPARAGAGYALLFTGLFLAIGAHLAFFPLWLEDRGLSTAEIGALTAFAVAVRIAAGVVLPALSDRLGAPRAVMGALALLGALAALLHLGVETRLGLYVLTLFLAAAFAGLIPLTDASAYAAADRDGFAYPKVRSAGSFAFLAATFLVGGLAERAGSDAVIWWMAAALALAAAATLAVSTTGPAPAPAAQGGAASPARATGAVLRAFLTDRRFLLFLAAVGAINASHGVYYVYGSVHWRALGFSETVIGALWAWGVMAEIALFFYGRAWLERIGPERALMAAGAAAVLRWAAMALDPGLAGAAVLQTLHGLTFGAMHLASLAFIARAAPPDARATAQGLMTAVAGGLAMLAATALAAWAYAAFAGAAYLFAALFGLAGLALAAALRARRP